MAEGSPAVSTFVRRFAAHVAGQRAYLSYGERAQLLAVVGRSNPGYDDVRLGQDVLFRNVQLLRTALGAVADEGAPATTDALVAAIQIALADNWLDPGDAELVHWVGDALGFAPARVQRALELAGGCPRRVDAARCG